MKNRLIALLAVSLAIAFAITGCGASGGTPAAKNKAYSISTSFITLANPNATVADDMDFISSWEYRSFPIEAYSLETGNKTLGTAEGIFLVSVAKDSNGEWQYLTMSSRFDAGYRFTKADTDAFVEKSNLELDGRISAQDNTNSQTTATNNSSSNSAKALDTEYGDEGWGYMLGYIESSPLFGTEDNSLSLTASESDSNLGDVMIELPDGSVIYGTEVDVWEEDDPYSDGYYHIEQFSLQVAKGTPAGTFRFDTFNKTIDLELSSDTNGYNGLYYSRP